jgi:hypothetical protein
MEVHGIVTKNPFMVRNNRWWYVVVDKDEFVYDAVCTTKQYFAMYKELSGEEIEYDRFVELAKAGELDLTKYDRQEDHSRRHRRW